MAVSSAEEMKTLGEMHKQGLINNNEWAKILEEYLSAQVTIDPAAQHHHGVFPMIYKDGLPKMAQPDHTHKVNISSGVGSALGAAQARAKEPFMPRKEELMRALGIRLRVPEGEMYRMDFLDFHVGKEKVFVFVVHNDQPVTIEDDRGLFPSDALITAINLLRDSNVVL